MVSTSEANWLLNVTINDISVIYVTAHRYAGGLNKVFDLRSGSQRHRHFVGLFNVTVQAPTQGHPYIRLYRETAPYSRLFTTHWGYGGYILDLTPGSSHQYMHVPKGTGGSVSGRVSVPCRHATSVANFKWKPFIIR